MRTASVALLLTVSTLRASDPVVSLYDPTRSLGAPTSTLTEDGWFPVSSRIFDPGFFYEAGEGVTRFDSFPAEETGAWTTVGLITGDVLHPDAPVLDSEAGFTLALDLAIEAESHESALDIDRDGLIDEAGFTVMMLDREVVGVAVNFWEDRIWTSSDKYVSDGDPLAQAEGVVQDPSAMARMRTYTLTIKKGAYLLSVEGTPILEGPVRDYDRFGLTLNPFNKPNIITIGDASFRAGARAQIGPITIQACYDPDESPGFMVSPDPEGVRLRWATIPGVRYTLQEGPDLKAWRELRSFVAESFSASFVEPRRAEHDSRYYRVERVDP